MNTFNKKSLYAAIAGLGALGAVGTAEAVHVNPDGLGQVLIYPYYTARTRTTGLFTGSQYNSLISVVNTTASAKAVKVRFLESLDSREVLDFNLYLSAYDVWTAGVVPTSDGAGLVTADVSCTTPAIAKVGTTPTPFLNYQYSGKNTDGADTSLDRSREGYVEIIEMANIVDNGDGTGSKTWSGVTHSQGSAGTPTCKGIQGSNGSDYTTPNGGLFGSMTIINVLATAETGYDPTAIDDWNDVSIWSLPSTLTPNLSSGDIQTSEVFVGGGVKISDWSTNFPDGKGNNINAVSASMMHETIMNEYILDSATNSGTDWIVTYPTKRFYVHYGPKVTGANVADPPFQNNFAGKACDTVGINFWDREENQPSGPPAGFSPPPPGNPPSSLCYEANVVTFNKTNVFASPVSANISTPYQNGWAQLNLIGGQTPPVHQMIANTSVQGDTTYNGLPVVGFATATFYNGTLPVVSGNPTGAATQSAYGGSYKHKATTTP
jgi:hypothetical protein